MSSGKMGRPLEESGRENGGRRNERKTEEEEEEEMARRNRKYERYAVLEKKKKKALDSSRLENRIMSIVSCVLSQVKRSLLVRKSCSR